MRSERLHLGDRMEDARTGGDGDRGRDDNVVEPAALLLKVDRLLPGLALALEPPALDGEVREDVALEGRPERTRAVGDDALLELAPELGLVRDDRVDTPAGTLEHLVTAIHSPRADLLAGRGALGAEARAIGRVELAVPHAKALAVVPEVLADLGDAHRDTEPAHERKNSGGGLEELGVPQTKDQTRRKDGLPSGEALHLGLDEAKQLHGVVFDFAVDLQSGPAGPVSYLTRKK